MAEEKPFHHIRGYPAAAEPATAAFVEAVSALTLSSDPAVDELRRSALALQLAIPEAEICQRLRIAVEEAASRSAESMHALRHAVCNFTLALRDEGTTPERVLIALKTIVNNRALLVIAPHTSDWRGDHLRETISTWCIEEFFKEKTA
jgi:hypothetical protein